jgi:DegV family protein with EDD domain
MKIVTDSAADLPVNEIEEYGIEVAPLSIHFPEGEVKSNEISPDEFYDRLRAMVPKTPTTSQPSAGFFSNLYRKVASAGEEILSVHISSGLSGTLEAARLGAEHIEEVTVTPVDSLTLSGGQRFQVLAAALAAKAGWSIQAIQDRLDQIRASTEVIYTLETLDYLARGGRIGRVQALAGSILHLKPIINVDKKDGKYNSIGKERTLNKAMLKNCRSPSQRIWDRNALMDNRAARTVSRPGRAACRVNPSQAQGIKVGDPSDLTRFRCPYRSRHRRRSDRSDAGHGRN